VYAEEQKLNSFIHIELFGTAIVNTVTAIRLFAVGYGEYCLTKLTLTHSSIISMYLCICCQVMPVVPQKQLLTLGLQFLLRQSGVWRATIVLLLRDVATVLLRL
jgi:hypothetical protein